MYHCGSMFEQSGANCARFGRRRVCAKIHCLSDSESSFSRMFSSKFQLTLASQNDHLFVRACISTEFHWSLWKTGESLNGQIILPVNHPNGGLLLNMTVEPICIFKRHNGAFRRPVVAIQKPVVWISVSVTYSCQISDTLQERGDETESTSFNLSACLALCCV